uniref:Protein UL95 n=1 Tax=Otarine gammaherpesvirus 4 TaxID=2801541 RepID=A0A889IW82_9GAMA|nr:hypothetical protein [Otarine gammaherpesvirus 4]
MFSALALDARGDPERTKQYARGVELAMRLCEQTPEQFKLIETPLSSFLLVSNVMPDDIRPWNTHNFKDLDFSGLCLPRLKMLDSIVGHGGNDTSPMVYRFGGNADGDKVSTSELAGGATSWLNTNVCSSDDVVDQKSSVCNNEQCIESKCFGNEGTCPGYIPYEFKCWQRALSLNRDDIINEAVFNLALPKHWHGTLPVDPLPWVWLLFYGKYSFCNEEECIYQRSLGRPGPVLFPPHLYAPLTDINSFMAHVCRIVKHLYGNSVSVSDVIVPDARPPFNIQRLQQVLKKMVDVNDDEPVYIARRCLPCTLYQQNAMAYKISSGLRTCIILQGEGQKYITEPLGRSRCTLTGDVILWPTYNITSILRDMGSHGPN